MADAESEVKKGRIRHCYPRSEVYHRWIHSSEYVYAANGSLISGKYNYLRCQDIGKFVKDEDIKEMWNYHKHSVIAVIDRDKKRICISVKYNKWYVELLNALPDNYEIFWCSGEIPTPTILSFTSEDKEILCKEHLKYVIERYTEDVLRPFYNILNGRPILHTDINNLHTEPTYRGFKYPTYDSIKLFVKKYKIKSYSWFKESLNSKFKLNTYYPYNWSSITIAIPSIKKILNDTVFTESQKLYFRQKYFYTKYCYGRGIPFKDVERFWNVEVLSQKMYDYFNKHNIYWLDTYRDESCVTWNDYIIRSYQIEENHRNKYIQDNIAKSNQNRKEAEAKAQSQSQIAQNVIIQSWRKGECINRSKICFKEFYPPRRKNQRGFWKDSYIYCSNIGFKNTQLKLVGKNVITSHNASVPLSSAITAFHLIEKCVEDNLNTGKILFEYSDKIKVGIYNLRDIQYSTKYTDNGDRLNYKTWLIRIGCHSLWLDDIMDFIQYYHLENKFITNALVQPKMIKI